MSNPSETFWTAGFLNERFSAPVSPLGWSVVGAIFEKYALRDPLRFMGYPAVDRIPATRLVRGHPYSNVLIFQIVYNPFPDALVPADAVRYFPKGDVSWRKQAPYPRSTFNPRFLASLLAHFVRDPINWSPLNYWQWRRYTRLHDRRVKALHAHLDHATTPAEILAVIAGADQAHADFAKIHRWSLTYADIFYKLLVQLVGESAQPLISGVPNLTQSVNDDLRALGQLAARLSLHLDSDQAIADALCNREFSGAVEQFLHKHGHRSFSLDIAVPTFRDDPAQFLRLLPSEAEPPRPAQNLPSARNAARARLPLWQKGSFDVILSFARRYASLREDQRYYWQKSLAVSRRAYLMLTEHLRAQQVVTEPDDVFYVTSTEVAACFDQEPTHDDLKRTIEMRRAEWSRYQQAYEQSPALAYPAFLRGDLPLDVQAPAASGTTTSEAWQGRGVSPGQAHGRVRVVLDPRDLSRVASGEILVAPATDPGWTPVFGRLAGLVLERGGVLAHGAIVAREHHLPAVAGLTNITRELKDGDWVQVDGTQGIVRRV